MQPGSLTPTKSISALLEGGKVSIRLAAIGTAAGVLLLLFLAFFRLPYYPATWFDEGAHLHVPKTLVQYGVYADRSSEGFRYYGPTVSVGPTVMLPVAAVFKLFGIGLLQARTVIVAYLLASVVLFYLLARRFGGYGFALAAAALFVTSRGVSLIVYGRQVLGEVPALFFLLAGLLVLFSAWDRPVWKRLALAGLFFGLSVVTKSQYLVVIAPGLGAAWLANLLYYKRLASRLFVVPAALMAALFLSWQAFLVLYLGPAAASENYVLLKEAAQDAALVFSPALMVHNLRELVSLKVFLSMLFPSLVYGAIVILPRRREAQQMSLLYFMIAANLLWYGTASIGWLRYAFPGLSLSAIFITRFFHDLSGGFHLQKDALQKALRTGGPELLRQGGRLVLLTWLGLMIMIPFGQTLIELIRPPERSAQEMASYMDQYVSKTAIVETWEPEMGFLTDHNYHYPPQNKLYQAVNYIWINGEAPTKTYTFIETNHPDYVLVGTFANWVEMYPQEELENGYRLIEKAGAYELYQRVP